MSDISTPTRAPYPTDLTDEQWELVEPFVRASECGPQEVLHSRREVVNAILYISHTGAQWRYMPHDLPDWRLVYHYFRSWKKNGTLKLLHDALRGQVRKKAADVHDSSAAHAILPLAAKQYPSLRKTWADSAYQGARVQAVAQESGIELEVVKRSDQQQGFVVQPKRWVSERTFGWLNRDRRLSKDYERTEESSEAFIHVSMIRRLA
jgi:putative transposase